MNIFRLFSSKRLMKICSKSHQIASFKKNSQRSMPPNPTSKRLFEEMHTYIVFETELELERAIAPANYVSPIRSYLEHYSFQNITPAN